MTDRTASSRAPRTRRMMPAARRTPLALVAAMLRELFDPYRPELHYMRGPGPKWRAKHQPVAAEPAAGAHLVPA